MSHPDQSLEKDCHCEDPYNVGKKLLLCGKAICKRLSDKTKPLPTLIRSVEDDKQSTPSS